MASKYIALIPAYEPDRKMLGVISDLGKQGFDVVLIDDGSGIEYSELFEEAAERLPGRSGHGVTLLIHNENKGKGAALKTGLDFIGNFMVVRGEERQNIIVTIDADGQHMVKDAVRTAQTAEAHPGTLVLGSRKPKSEGSHHGTPTSDNADPEYASAAPLRSRFGNAVTREVFRFATGTSVYDTQTGLRAFTADLIPALLSVRGDRYEYELNMLMEFSARGIPIEETGIETVYYDGNKNSHFGTFRDSYRIYREIAAFMMNKGGRKQNHRAGSSGGGTTVSQALRFSASSFVSFLIDYAMYALLLFAGPGLVFANIGARIISSAVNFAINRKIVFRSDSNIAASALQYFALAALILTGNTFVLKTLTGTFGINSLIAKVMTETIFFIISWIVQKYVIFYNGANTAAAAEVKGEADIPCELSGRGCADADNRRSA